MSDDPMAPHTCLPRRRQRGFGYVEVLIAMVIIVVCLVPMLDALRDGVRAAGTQLDYTKNQQRLKSCFEVILAKSFTALNAAADSNTPSSSVAADTLDASCAADPDPLQPHPDPLLVTMYRYDCSPPTGCVPTTDPDTGLLWIKVAIEGSNLSLDTLKSRW